MLDSQLDHMTVIQRSNHPTFRDKEKEIEQKGKGGKCEAVSRRVIIFRREEKIRFVWEKDNLTLWMGSGDYQERTKDTISENLSFQSEEIHYWV